MRSISNLLNQNRSWAAAKLKQDPEFFSRLVAQQSPEYLWIGCSDSRVPANQIVGLLPGELFVHRNVANVVVHSDLNCLSVMQFAVDVLKVRHIMVVGHYGCGGVRAALRGDRCGLVDNWLRHIQDIRQKHDTLIATLPDEDAKCDLLCELNVIEQVVNVCRTTVLREAWERGQEVVVHGWVYGIRDGIIRDLNINVGADVELASVYAKALESVSNGKPGS
ncbi:MAG TPA: carbonate dehydratase [Roseimicrobium sp.]|nr:carbonate dehydratase [Roseimicrobium sp.]